MKNEKMKQFEDILNNIEIDLKKMENPITKKINELSKRINCELKQSVDLSADATSYRQVLIDTGYKYSITSRILGVTVKTVYNKIRYYNINTGN